MPSIKGDEGRPSSPVPLTHLPFPRLSRSHILHCSYHFWHPIYRSITPKARLITLTPAFLSYLREDGIVLPPDDDAEPSWTDEDSGVFSDASDSDDDALIDPSENFREVHLKVKEVIEELDGHVAPKLNWSAPKDATWIATTNSMECRTPGDIYLLLKSSDFVTHDLEHAFDDCEPPETPEESQDIPFTLVLRKYINLNPSVEFRCFVRDRELIAICQRDLNHFDFLFPMVDELRSRIQKFFDEKLKDTFPDANFAFDVYIPPPHKRVWLIDINPWAQRTDPLLFSWLELLSMQTTTSSVDAQETSFGISGGQDEEVEELPFTPVFRLVKKDDPEAYSFNTPQYSAHKMPKDVVDASAGPGPLREFAEQWKDIMRRQEQEDADDD